MSFACSLLGNQFHGVRGNRVEPADGLHADFAPRLDAAELPWPLPAKKLEALAVGPRVNSPPPQRGAGVHRGGVAGGSRTATF
jgi:hypothetical protein